MFPSNDKSFKENIQIFRVHHIIYIYISRIKKISIIYELITVYNYYDYITSNLYDAMMITGQCVESIFYPVLLVFTVS